MTQDFPEIIDTRALRIFIDDAFNQVVINYGEALEIAFLPVLRMLSGIESFLLWLPWYVVLILLCGATYWAARSWAATVGTAVMLFLIGVVGIWEPAMATIALMLTVLPVVFLAGSVPLTYQGLGVMEALIVAMLLPSPLADANQLVSMLVLFRLFLILYALVGALMMLRGDIHLHPQLEDTEPAS